MYVWRCVNSYMSVMELFICPFFPDTLRKKMKGNCKETTATLDTDPKT